MLLHLAVTFRSKSSSQYDNLWNKIPLLKCTSNRPKFHSPGATGIWTVPYTGRRFRFPITVTSHWARWRCLKSRASRLFTQLFDQAQIKEDIKAPRHWPLWGEFTGDRWISRTKGQWRGKCFHLMTSSCKIAVPNGIKYVRLTSVMFGPTTTYFVIYLIW